MGNPGACARRAANHSHLQGPAAVETPRGCDLSAGGPWGCPVAENAPGEQRAGPISTNRPALVLGLLAQFAV